MNKKQLKQKLRSLGWGVRLSNKAVVITYKGRDYMGFYSPSSAVSFLKQQVLV